MTTKSDVVSKVIALAETVAPLVPQPEHPRIVKTFALEVPAEAWDAVREELGARDGLPAHAEGWMFTQPKGGGIFLRFYPGDGRDGEFVVVLRRESRVANAEANAASGVEQ